MQIRLQNKRKYFTTKALSPQRSKSCKQNKRVYWKRVTETPEKSQRAQRKYLDYKIFYLKVFKDCKGLKENTEKYLNC